jgi:hypothetical protein
MPISAQYYDFTYYYWRNEILHNLLVQKRERERERNTTENLEMREREGEREK